MHNPAEVLSPQFASSWLGPKWWWLGLAGFAAICWGCAASTESLWVDELHTSWTVAGDFSDVASRARAGNQSPLFFWFLFGLNRTLGFLSLAHGGFFPAGLWLRLPSIVCWSALVCVCLRVGRGGVGRGGVGRGGVGAMLVAILVWLLVDRVQLFYATEARVYAAVQLVSLLAWLAVWRIGAREGSDVVDKQYVWIWCGLSVLLVFLHITAVLAVACQIAWGTLLVIGLSRDQRIWRSGGLMIWGGGVAVVSIAVVAALFLSARVWEHRAQWDSFAGEATLTSFLGLFPLAAYAVPLALARIVDYLSRVRGKECGPTLRRRLPLLNITLSSRGLWWVATLGPWLAAWGVTALNVAPIFHRRFVIVSAVPLIILAAMEVGRIQRPSLRWSAVLGVAAWLAVSQGTLDNWRSGHWFGWQRWEGWRQATSALNTQVQVGDELWCASGLVEAAGATLPLNDELSRYLSFPLRGAYSVRDSSGKFVEPQALLTSGIDWAEQLIAASKGKPAISQTKIERPTKEQIVWIVYRGSPEGFQLRLDVMQKRMVGLGGIQLRIEQPQAFGLVSVVQLSYATSSMGETP